MNNRTGGYSEYDGQEEEIKLIKVCSFQPSCFLNANGSCTYAKGKRKGTFSM